MPNPIGAVYQISDKVSRDNAVAYSHQAQHFTTTSLNDFILSQRLKKEAGVRYSIYRNESWEPGDMRRANAPSVQDEAKAAYAAIMDVDRSIHVLINNEQEWTNERFQFYNELIKLTLADSKGPVGMVFGNFASGSVKCGQGQDPNWWATTPAAGDFLRLLSANEHVRLPDGTQAFILGVHEYTALYPWSAANGGELLASDWNLRSVLIDWDKPQWHIGRMIQGIRNAGLPVPYIIVTETLFDDMRDIIDAWNARFDYKATGLRGYRTYTEFWKHFGFTVPIGVVYHKFLEWTWKTVWSSSNRVLGVQVFMYGGWDTFDVSQDEDFKKANSIYRGSINEPIPVPDISEDVLKALEILNNRIIVLEQNQPKWVTKEALQGHFQQLMIWTADNFVAKSVLRATITGTKTLLDSILTFMGQQNVE